MRYAKFPEYLQAFVDRAITRKRDRAITRRRNRFNLS
jgi:hypothetical protein